MDRNDLSKMIGLNIRKYRTRQTLSQENLALDAGIHPAYLGQLERGEKCPNIDTLLKISDALKIPIARIVDIEKNLDTASENTSDNISAIQQNFLDSLNKLSDNKQKQLITIMESIIQLYISE